MAPNQPDGFDLMRQLGAPQMSYPSQGAAFADWMGQQPALGAQTVMPAPAPVPPQPVYGWGRTPQVLESGPTPEQLADQAAGNVMKVGAQQPAPPQMQMQPRPQYQPSPQPAPRRGRGGKSLGMRAIEQQSQAEIDLANEQLAAYGQTATAQKEEVGKLEARADQEQAEYDRVWAEHSKSAAEAREETVDRDRWWSGRSSGQRIALGAATFLGGFLEGFTSGQVRNKARQYIEMEIDRDIAMQQNAIEQKSGDRQEMRGMLGMLSTRIQNAPARMAQTKAALATDLSQRLQEAALRAQEPMIKARLLEARAAAQAAAASAQAAAQAAARREALTLQKAHLAERKMGLEEAKFVAEQQNAQGEGTKLSGKREATADAAGAAVKKLGSYVSEVLHAGRWSGEAGKVFDILPGYESKMTSIEEAYTKPLGGMLALGAGAGNAVQTVDKYAKTLPTGGMGKDAFKERTKAIINQQLMPQRSALDTARATGDKKQVAALEKRIRQIAADGVAILKQIDAD